VKICLYLCTPFSLSLTGWERFVMSKNTERFHHGYNHCRGIGCDKAADCAQHLALLEAQELGLKNIKECDECDDKEMNYCRVIIEPPDVKKS